MTAAPGCPAADIDPIDKVCKWDALPYTGQTTNNKRQAVVSSTHFRIGWSINANFEITASGCRDTTTSSHRSAPTTAAPPPLPASGTTCIDKKMVGPFSYPEAAGRPPMQSVPVPVEIRARLMDTGNGFNFNRTDSNQSRAMLALDGTSGDWDWKSASATWSRAPPRPPAPSAPRATPTRSSTDLQVRPAERSSPAGIDVPGPYHQRQVEDHVLRRHHVGRSRATAGRSAERRSRHRHPSRTPTG